ncbi:acyltransferase family protein [Phenylobacterium montanum]|uniref:Acyltransferase n=1 Tax=Phenylobacterium montanum TaxID=2823693 RepID=A0A975IWN7_9CAUL|nr:acyltransferase [Caulobacter sp. S6]QUD90078.1 acyltransferase [Caulobacter sp. S6]
MDKAPARRAFQTLDGLRGVGAFLVVMRHVGFLFGPIRVPESFLAVDLFYLVSGFVVAHAYGQRLERGGFFWEFVRTRLIRLYPLYAVGLLLGVAVATIAVVTDPRGWWNPVRLAEAIATGLFMIPLFPGLKANGSSLDGPVWTLLPELVANFLYAAAARFMKTGVLLAIIAVGAAGVVAAELRYDSLDVGFNATDQWAALARVTFSFFMGVLVFRFFGEREQKSELAAWVAMAALTAILAWRPSNHATAMFELAVVLFGFPALLIAAARFEPGAWTGRLFSHVGLVSYGVYIVHQPIGNLIRVALKHGPRVPADWRALLIGALFLLFLVWFATWLDRRVDAPVRRWLRARFLPRRA